MSVGDGAPADAVEVRPFGDRGLLIEVDGLPAVLDLHARLEAARPTGVLDLVPAARTVLVRVDPRVLSLPAARAWIARATGSASAPAAEESAEVELDIVYDGLDLARTASLLEVTADELVRHHLEASWTVAFTGFAPGFGYLVSDDWPFEVPRLDSPRTRVPAGAVGLAGAFTGAYPRMTPGGWRLIGTTSAPLFDPDAAEPALLTPGTRVRFRERGTGRPVDAAADSDRGGSVQVRRTGSPQTPGTAASADAGGRAAGEDAERAPDAEPAPDAADPVVRILDPGMRASVQDLGRPGHAAIGVAGSGALDRAALRLANRLVGNREDAAGIEVTMGGLRAIARRSTWIAVAGGWGAVRIDGREIEPYRAHTWEMGAQLDVDWLSHGARCYLAVRGGLDAAVVLGSRATDSLAGLGPAPLTAGVELSTADAVAGPIPIRDVEPWAAPEDAEIEVELAPGPRADWFDDDAHRILYDSIWTVSSDTDRVGMRLDGPELTRARGGELPSEGMIPGALQVPPSGRPTVLLADGPVTGGYPVIAVATDAALDALAQARPGARVRFRHARPAR